MMLNDSDVRRINNIVSIYAQEAMLFNSRGKTLGQCAKRLSSYARELLIIQYKKGELS